MNKSWTLTGRSLAAYIFNILMKVLLIVVVAYPFLWAIFTAFKPYPETVANPPTFFPADPTMEGMTAMLAITDVWHYMKNSLIVSFSVLALQYIVIIPASYAFARCRFLGKKFFFGIVLLGFMVPQQVTFIPVYLSLSKAGLLQSYWPQILPFIANAFGIFLLRQYFMQIPEEIIEAARLDNASELKIIFKIMIPMARPALFTIGLLSFISSWNSYFWPLIMTTNDVYRPMSVAVAMLKSIDQAVQWNVLMAGNLFLMGPILIVYIIASKYIRNAFAYSGIK